MSALLDMRVFHVDFGSSEWVSVKDVKPLVTKFLSQPRQVVKYRLANLKPEGLEDNTLMLVQKIGLQLTGLPN